MTSTSKENKPILFRNKHLVMAFGGASRCAHPTFSHQRLTHKIGMELQYKDVFVIFRRDDMVQWTFEKVKSTQRVEPWVCAEGHPHSSNRGDLSSHPI